MNVNFGVMTEEEFKELLVEGTTLESFTLELSPDFEEKLKACQERQKKILKQKEVNPEELRRVITI